MIKLPPVKFVPIIDLVSRDDVNFREPDNYNLDLLIEQIKVDGHIHTPIDCYKNGERFVALRGNRRIRAGQRLWNDETIPVSLKESLKKVPVRIWEGLTEQEKTKMIADQGREKPLAKVEIVKAVWRMFLNGFSEKEIILHFYEMLANFTGNTSKKNLVDALTGKEKMDTLHTWLHGTMQGITAVLKFPKYVQAQYILTLRKGDGLWKKDEVCNGFQYEMEISSGRIKLLTSAKKADEDGKIWNPETGGPKFLETLEKFKAEENGQPKEKSTKPSVKQLKGMQESYLDPATKALCAVAAGEKLEGVNLVDLDAENYRNRRVMDVLKQFATNDKVPEHLRQLYDAIATFEVGKLEVLLSKI